MVMVKIIVVVGGWIVDNLGAILLALVVELRMLCYVIDSCNKDGEQVGGGGIGFGLGRTRSTAC